MDDLMQWLYIFVNETRMGSIYEAPEYKELAHSVKLQTEKVESSMTSQQKDDMALLLENIVAQCAFENRYLFQATLELVQELHSLA